MSRAAMTIHGFLTDVNDFGRLYDYLDFYDEVVKCEIPGHNGEVDFSKFNVEDTVSVITHTFDRLKKKHGKVDVIGFSMGGALASYICATRQVNKAVLLSPSNKYINLRSAVTSIKFYLRYLTGTFSKTKGALKERISETYSGFAPYKKNIDLSAQVAIKRILPNISAHTFNVFRTLMNIADDAVEKSAPVSVPTFMLWGNLDELVPKSSVQFIEEHFSSCETKLIEDLGHAMLMTNKDNILIGEIVNFLTDGEIQVDVPLKED
ncbi:MAG: alpha/beta hydrolase [Corallococcus sp.]|nr:alpha/beta hydrolase [Bacillota bacterium]MCM1533061.1 alpha/beta hydrolase [Corallococcus sp.]